MKPKNLKEFKALIKRYETITLEEIKDVIYTYRFRGSDIAHKLTGFGDEDDCMLCKNINTSYDYECKGCVYMVTTGSYCSRGVNKKTMIRINYANTPLKLLNAFRARAKHMKTLIS